MTALADGLRLGVGTLTVLPVRPPGTVAAPVPAVAMAAAPLVAVPLAALAAGAVTAGDALRFPPLVVATLTVGALAVASGGLHLDGLADTGDGLAAPGTRERRLEVMRRGDVGPTGAALLVLVLLTQVGALAGLVAARGTADSAVAVGLAVLVSRAVLPVACARGVPAARSSGLGSAVAGSVPRALAVAVPALVAAVAVVLDRWHALAGVALAAVVVGLLLAAAARRVGGVTGDVLGACVELALAAYLVAQTAHPG